MPTVIYAATPYNYCIQVIDSGKVVYDYTAGNHQKESQAVINPSSLNAVKLRQLKRWARQTAEEVAQSRGIPLKRVAYDADLEAELKELDERWGKS